MGESRDGSVIDARDEADATGRTARGVGAEEAAPAEAAGETIRDAAGRFTSDLRGAADLLIEDQKVRLADLTQGLANALRRSADAFAEEGGTVVARLADQAADQVELLSDTVRRESWRALAANVEVAARRRPELFLAGAVAAGFLLARLLSGTIPVDDVEA